MPLVVHFTMSKTAQSTSLTQAQAHALAQAQAAAHGVVLGGPELYQINAPPSNTAAAAGAGADGAGAGAGAGSPHPIKTKVRFKTFNFTSYNTS